MLAFFGCSRESSVKENVNLKNNHSRVFAFDKPIPETFIDSLTNAPVNEADSIPDENLQRGKLVFRRGNRARSFDCT